MNKKIKQLWTKGFSLREISNTLNVPYSTVRRYCKDISMTEAGKKRFHSRVNGVIRYIRINDKISTERIRLISHLLFDGSVYNNDFHYSIMYINSSRDLVNQFRNDVQSVYGIKPSSFEIITGKNVVYFRIKYLSKMVYDDLLKYFITYSTADMDCSIPEWLMKSEERFKIILLRAFWEDEGSISKDGKLSADLKSLRVIQQLSKIHHELGLQHYISRYWKNGWAYKLILNKSRENYTRFMRLDLFSQARVCKGSFIGMKKGEVLKKYFETRWVR